MFVCVQADICAELYEIIRNFRDDSGRILCESFIRSPKRRFVGFFFPSHCTFCAVIHKEVIILMKDSILVLMNYFKSTIMMKLHEVIFVVIVISYQRYTVKHRYSLLHCYCDWFCFLGTFLSTLKLFQLLLICWKYR